MPSPRSLSVDEFFAALTKNTLLFAHSQAYGGARSVANRPRACLLGARSPGPKTDQERGVKLHNVQYANRPGRCSQASFQELRSCAGHDVLGCMGAIARNCAAGWRHPAGGDGGSAKGGRFEHRAENRPHRRHRRQAGAASPERPIRQRVSSSQGARRASSSCRCACRENVPAAVDWE